MIVVKGEDTGEEGVAEKAELLLLGLQLDLFEAWERYSSLEQLFSTDSISELLFR